MHACSVIHILRHRYLNFRSNLHQLTIRAHIDKMASGAEDRAYWVGMAVKVASPVLRALAARELKAKMPVEGCGDERYAGGRQMFSHLEAIARLLVGIAPWLECAGLSGEEEILRAEFAGLTRQAIDSATDPQSPDFVNFSYSFQPIVVSDLKELSRSAMVCNSRRLEHFCTLTRRIAPAFAGRRIPLPRNPPSPN